MRNWENVEPECGTVWHLMVETPRPINLSEVEHEPADEHETESEPNCKDGIAAVSKDVGRKGRTISPLSEILKYVPTQKEKSP